jgi:threonine dehydrogenase-like Zn-dependent dehydrogenase
MKVWRPRTAFVMGAGQIGLLTTLVLRLRGLEVYTVARTPAPTLSSEIVTGLGAHYFSTRDRPLADLAKQAGKADLILDATGSSQVAFGAMELLGHNGVLVWASITGGDQKVEVPGDKINLDWVLGNKLLMGSVNANRDHFEMGIRYLALGEVTYPGVTQRILTHPVQGLENYEQMMKLLVDAKSALKVYMEVADG